jgi:hypothetical protein
MGDFFKLEVGQIMTASLYLAGCEVISGVLELEGAVDDHSVMLVVDDGCLGGAFIAIRLALIFLSVEFLVWDGSYWVVVSRVSFILSKGWS